MISDIDIVLRHYRSRQCARYRIFENYYNGDHPLTFATDKFRDAFGYLFQAFADNLCPAVVDSLNDRLRITGFSSSNARTSTETITVDVPNGEPIERPRVIVDDPASDEVTGIWRHNRMDLRAIEVTREAIKKGDSYVIVWPDGEGRVAIWPQKAQEMYVEYSSETPGVIEFASKCWAEWIDRKRYIRVNLFYPDHVEKYITSNEAKALPEKSDSFVLYPDDPGGLNPYGKVPVFHFANLAMYAPGISALKDAVPIQDALNKSVCDMLVAMEFAAFKQRYAIGVEVELNEETGKPEKLPFQSGPGNIWTSPDSDTKFGEFSETDLDKFLNVSEKFRAQIARVTGTPLHYFFITTGDFPSGEALKSAEGRFINKIEEAQTNFGNIWEDVVQFARYIETGSEDATFDCVWKSAAPKTEAEIADIATKKQAVGVSKSQNLKELGYDDDTIDRMFAENAAAFANLAAPSSLVPGTGFTSAPQAGMTGAPTNGGPVSG